MCKCMVAGVGVLEGAEVRSALDSQRVKSAFERVLV